MSGPVVPVPTPETRPHWDAAVQGRLVIQRCAACEQWNFPPRQRCPHCSADRLEWLDASGRGTLWSYIIVHRAEPEFRERAPYVLAVVALEEGPHMLGTLREVAPDPAAIVLDAPVSVAFEQRGETAIPYWLPGASA